MADAAHHFGRLAWAVADGIGDDYEPADTATMAAQTAPYAALTGGAAHGIATARTVLQDHYQRCPRGQQGDCVMVTAVPMSERVGSGSDFAWVGDCRAYTVQNGTLRQVTDDHTEGQKMRGWNDPYWAKIADSYDHIMTRSVLRDQPIDYPAPAGHARRPRRRGRSATGGIRLVARAAGVREATVSLGVGELDSEEAPLGRIRRVGGGRKRVVALNPALRGALVRGAVAERG